MSPLQFSVAVFGLLILPGPTNALFAAVAARRGFARALSLMPAALLAYGIGISVIMTAATQSVRIEWLLVSTGKIIIALYLGYLAYRLWSAAPGAARWRAGAPGAWDLFATTLVNPKVAVLAYLLLAQMPGSASLVARTSLIGAAIALAACLWAALGAGASGTSDPRGPRAIERIASIIIGIAGLGTFASALGDVIST